MGEMELRDWKISQYDDKLIIIVGKIFGDLRGYFYDGQIIHTSLVQSIDFEKGIVKTLNSTYKLID